jgi:hypothetical protein
MTTDNKTYYRLSASLKDPDNPTSVVLENMDGSKVSPHIQNLIAMCLQEQAEQREYVYIAKTTKPEQHGYKVGRTKDLSRRERELGMQIVLTIPCDVWGDFSATKLESILHELYDCAGLRINREWFDLTWWDIELLRASYRDGFNYAQKQNFFYFFQEATRRFKLSYPTTSPLLIKAIMRGLLRFWKKDSEPTARICLTYVVRRLFVEGYIPESLYRYAIEETIFWEHDNWYEKHIRPIEKTFEEAVAEYLNNELAAP